jgi:hypothetical protein
MIEEKDPLAAGDFCQGEARLNLTIRYDKKGEQ